MRASATPETLGRALAAAPDPEMARVALSRVGEAGAARRALEEPGATEAAVLLLGFSSAAADFLVAHPKETALFADIGPRDRAALLREAEADVRRRGPEAGLRRFRRRALYRVAARDLGGEALDAVVAEVTWIAEVCLELAARVSKAPGLAVIGMGKLGGMELNYASDVDVVFVHRDRDQEGAARDAEAIVRLLSEPTEDGLALRVDLGLRPDGRAGPLSRSADAFVDYERTRAATWERQALLKARPVAGDVGLAARLLQDLTPVIYPEDLAVSAIDDVRAMKARIEERVRASGKEAVEVKRGRGGIRDVEFAVQLLQLVHGRRDPALREPNTLRALVALADRGYVARDDAASLAGSYRFLRTLEHRLQLARELQTHELPSDEVALRRIARSMGIDSADALRKVYAGHTDTVRGLHERLFYRPLLEAFAGPRHPSPGTEERATVELLAGLGFREPERASRGFRDLVDPGTRMGQVLSHVFPVVAPALALASDPDRALVRLERVIAAVGDDPAAADALASDPAAARCLALVVGASEWGTDLLTTRPSALSVLTGRPDGRAEAGGAWREAPRLGRPVHQAESDAEQRYLSVVAAYLAGDLEVPESGRALARVADGAVAGALAEARPAVAFAVIGLGKLGGEELTFASDLDVVFVYEGEGPEAFEEAERVAGSVLAGVRASGFEADPDLRPEGRNGPLARSMAAYLEYWERYGRTWEFQSLLKARFVAGEEALGRRFTLAAEDFAYPDFLPVERVAEILEMRSRMERERVRPPDAGRFHFKLGYGSLADVTFAVEASQMHHGREHEAVRRRHTMDALEGLAAARLLEDGVALALGEAYVFLNEVKNALELDRRVSAEALPASPLDQVALARRLGYEERPRLRFLDDYRRITRRARRAMERVFYGER